MKLKMITLALLVTSVCGLAQAKTASQLLKDITGAWTKNGVETALKELKKLKKISDKNNEIANGMKAFVENYADGDFANSASSYKSSLKMAVDILTTLETSESTEVLQSFAYGFIEDSDDKVGINNWTGSSEEYVLEGLAKKDPDATFTFITTKLFPAVESTRYAQPDSRYSTYRRRQERRAELVRTDNQPALDESDLIDALITVGKIPEVEKEIRPKVLEFLASFIVSKNKADHHSIQQAKKKAIEAIGEMKTKEASQALAKLVNEDTPYRYIVAYNLGKIGGPEQVPSLLEVIEAEADRPKSMGSHAVFCAVRATSEIIARAQGKGVVISEELLADVVVKFNVVQSQISNTYGKQKMSASGVSRYFRVPTYHVEPGPGHWYWVNSATNLNRASLYGLSLLKMSSHTAQLKLLQKAAKK